MNRIKTRYLWTQFILRLEAFLKSFWPLLSWLLGFAGFWMLGVSLYAPSFLQIFLSGGFIAGFIWFGYKGFQNQVPLRPDAAARRLEQDSALQHRPLNALNDTPYQSDLSKTGENLWQRNQEALSRSIESLKYPSLRAVLSKRDPYALRLLSILLLLGGIFVSGPAWKERLWNGVLPGLSDADQNTEDTASLSIWIVPPQYTNLDQVELDLTQNYDDGLLVIEGSSIKANILPSRSILEFGAPKISVKDEEQDHLSQDFSNLDDHSFTLETILPKADKQVDYTIAIRHGFMTKFQTSYQTLRDLPPEISVNEPPAPLPGGLLRFNMNIKDDYGSETVSLRMHLDPLLEEDPPLGSPYNEERGVISPAGQDYTFEGVYDLSFHPWAGLPVIFTFSVSDATGQIATSEPLPALLPERKFRHPIAKKLIEYRKSLIWDPLSSHGYIYGQLESILENPQSFQYDLIATLAIRVAASRLYYTRQTDEDKLKTTNSLIPLLWDTALRIEDGNLSLAARDLRQAQNNLQRALQDPNANEAEVTQRLQEMRQALGEYLRELQKELQKRFAEGNPLLIDPQAIDNLLNSDALAEMLDRIQEQLQNGDRQGAQDMLSQLQEFMDSLNPSVTAPIPPQMQALLDGIDELQELIDKQKDLRDQTQIQAEQLQQSQGQDHYNRLYQQQIRETIQALGLTDLREIARVLGNLPPPLVLENAEIDTSENKTEQDALRFILGELMKNTAEKLDKIPETMGLAEFEMRDSSDDLAVNAPQDSVPHQNTAIEYLEQSQEDLSEQLQEQLQQMVGSGAMAFLGNLPQNPGQQGGFGPDYDPLGRPFSEKEDGQDGVFGSDVKIPNDAQQKTVREIQRLLRERSGDESRPREEREYFRRLLRRF